VKVIVNNFLLLLISIGLKIADLRVQPSIAAFLPSIAQECAIEQRKTQDVACLRRQKREKRRKLCNYFALQNNYRANPFLQSLTKCLFQQKIISQGKSFIKK